jgi:DNA-binding IclR family transcriptional regulator
VLGLFSRQRPQWRISEIAAELGLPLASSYRIVSTLESADFLERVEPRGPLRLGLRLLHLGALVQSGLDIRAVSHPRILGLATSTGETSLLVVPNDRGVVCIDYVEGGYPVRMRLTLGEQLQYEVGGAFTAAVLAFLSDERRAGIIREITASGLDGSALALRCATIRENSYAVAEGEIAVGISAVASPIFDSSGVVAGAIGVIGIADRFRGDRLLGLIATVRETADAISAGLGRQVQPAPPADPLTASDRR